jgi:hypothetical protein
VGNQHEVLKPQPLLGSDGIIVEPGYAGKLVWEYNKRQAKTGFMRLKEWDYYLVSSKKYAAAFTISDMSYIGLISVSLLDFEAKRDFTKTMLKLLPRGKMGLPETSETGDVHVSGKDYKLDYLISEGQRRIACEIDSFLDEKPFSCDISLEDLKTDSICIASAWKEKPTCFYLNQKVNCMRAKGSARLGGEEFIFNPDVDFGTLDWGRGVWTYDNTWYWGTGSGLIDGKPFGFNLGYGFSDRSCASENMLFYNRKSSKLDEVSFYIPVSSAGELDYMGRWTIKSSDGRFEAVLKPIMDRKAYIGAGPILSDQHQVFGLMDGECALDGGEKLAIQDFLCAIEHVRNKY